MGLAVFGSAPDTALAWCNPFEPKTLPQLEAWVADKYPAVPQRSSSDVLSATQPPLLLDVREPVEFAVSHLPGAIQVNPNASLAEVRHLIGPKLSGTPVLIYCSVGYRSSRLAERVRQGLLADGAPEVANLKGGIFAWANQGHPLVNAQGPTQQVHPYDDCRAPLLSPRARSAATP